MTNSPEKETLAAIIALLAGDTELTTQTGINPTSGTARNVAVYNQVPQNATVPYIKVTLSDTIPLSDETYDFAPVPAKTVSLVVSTFSDYEPEVFGIASRLEALLENSSLTTTNFNCTTWHKSTVFGIDNTSDPDKVYRIAGMRLRVNAVEA